MSELKAKTTQGVCFVRTASTSARLTASELYKTQFFCIIVRILKNASLLLALLTKAVFCTIRRLSACAVTPLFPFNVITVVYQTFRKMSTPHGLRACPWACLSAFFGQLLLSVRLRPGVALRPVTTDLLSRLTDRMTFRTSHYTTHGKGFREWAKPTLAKVWSFWKNGRSFPNVRIEI